MTDQRMENLIRTAVEHAAPDRLEQILSSCKDQMDRTGENAACESMGGSGKGEIIYMNSSRNYSRENGGKSEGSRKRRMWPAVAAVAAVLALCIGGFALFGGEKRPGIGGRVDSIILLDVNPSLSLAVDTEERVVEAKALNDDAREILGGMELEGASLEVAVNAVIGSMLQKGYLGDAQNSVLISVENDDAQRGEQLQAKVSQVIEAAMSGGRTDEGAGAAVLSQTVNGDDEMLQALADQYDISLGKAALIAEVTAQDPTLRFEDLAPLAINEIALITASRNISSDTVKQTGTASDQAYIGSDEALYRACAHAGVSLSDVQNMEREFDCENGTFVYDLEFCVGATRYEYDVNAFDGSIVSHCSEHCDEHAHSNHHQGNNYYGGTFGGGNAAGIEPETSAARSYIGVEAALAAALAHAGIDESSLIEREVKLDDEDGRMIYEVEFKTISREYEYDLDAFTGEILWSKNEGFVSPTAPAETGNTAPAVPGGNAAGIEPGTAAAQTYIGDEAALGWACAHAGVQTRDAMNTDIEFDCDDGGCYYDLEFCVGATRYEYEINALDGTVRHCESEPCGDHNHAYGQYGHHSEGHGHHR